MRHNQITTSNYQVIKVDFNFDQQSSISFRSDINIRLLSKREITTVIQMLQ
jgi:hypothetical protein